MCRWDGILKMKQSGELKKRWPSLGRSPLEYDPDWSVWNKIQLELFSIFKDFVLLMYNQLILRVSLDRQEMMWLRTESRDR